jgi:hypothetical protein
MSTPIPQPHAGQVFLLSPDGRDAEWVAPANIPARCAAWTDVTDLDIADLQIVASMRMQQNPQWGI